MITKTLAIFTRTPLHVGAGSSVGAVDQPIIRERHTRFPVIPGSSVKGVLRSAFSNEEDFDVDATFGLQESSGEVSFGEAKLLAFPVRSAKGSFAFLVSPVTLQRFSRDAGIELPVPTIEKTKCMAGPDVIFPEKNAVILEEYRFECIGEFPSEWANKLSSLLDDAVLKGGKTRFVLISDEDMSFYASNACQISQHVRIDPETGTASEGGLFNEETVPSETLFYAPIMGIRGDGNSLKAVATHFESEKLVQFGGSGTTGLGFCTVKTI